MKFDFNKDSRYPKFWTSQDILSTYIDVTPFLRTNHGFWRTQFDVDPNLTPTAPNGLASFTIESVTRKPYPMADVRAPLGRGKALDVEGVSTYSASIPNFIAPSIHEQAFERAQKEEIFNQFGKDKELILQWTRNVQGQMDSLNQTMSNMAAQLISTGIIDYKYGRGSNYASSANLPKENIVKAGTEPTSKAWTDGECGLLDQMAALEEKFRTDNGLTNIAMKWQIPYKMFNDVFLKNAQVRQLVVDYRTNNQQATTAGFVITEDIFRSIVSASYPSISPIEIIVEKEKDYSGDVMGWNPKVAVLRPAGYAGLIKHTSSLDVFMSKYRANSIRTAFTSVGEGSLFTLINTTNDNGDFKEWHTDMIMDAVPALNEVPYHLIVDTSKAGSGVTTLGE